MVDKELWQVSFHVFGYAILCLLTAIGSDFKLLVTHVVSPHWMSHVPNNVFKTALFVFLLYSGYIIICIDVELLEFTCLMLIKFLVSPQNREVWGLLSLQIFYIQPLFWNFHYIWICIWILFTGLQGLLIFLWSYFSLVFRLCP